MSAYRRNSKLRLRILYGKKRKRPDSGRKYPQVFQKRQRVFKEFDGIFDLPLEINMIIIKEMCSSKEINTLCRTSKEFCRICRDFVWIRAKELYQSIPLWCKSTDLMDLSAKTICKRFNALPVLDFLDDGSWAFGDEAKSQCEYFLSMQKDPSRYSYNICSHCGAMRCLWIEMRPVSLGYRPKKCIVNLLCYMAIPYNYNGEARENMLQEYKKIIDYYHLEELLEYLMSVRVFILCGISSKGGNEWLGFYDLK
jgi:hypothetical protein